MAENINSKDYSTQPKLKIYIKHGYHYLISHALYLFIIPGILAAAVHHLDLFHLHQISITDLCNYANHHLNHNINGSAIAAILFFLLATSYFLIFHGHKKVYLVDFACYKHDPSFLISRETIYEKFSGVMSPESLAFTAKVMERSGISDATYLYGTKDFPPESAFDCGREEAEIVISGAVDNLLAKTGVNPSDIGVVIVNISMVNPVPSLSAMIVNRYKLREDVLNYNLGGMGCSAGVIAIDLAKRLLQGERNTYALIMSLESATSSCYLGDDKSKLLPNCLFRMGGAAILLSNRSSDRRTSKYELKHTVRTHLGANDRAYKCIHQEEDRDGKLGITMSKDVPFMAGEALKANITALAPLFLPISEKLLFLANKVRKMKDTSPYVPNLKLAFEHVCVHTGGRAVLDEVEKRLKLTKWDMEPSRMTLYRYGNTSSSSLWYELAYAEAKGRVNKGDRVWQIGFGTGFKCCSAVWRTLRTINPNKENNPWTDDIDRFPVPV